MKRTSWLASTALSILAFTACSQAPAPAAQAQAPAEAGTPGGQVDSQAATNGLTGVYFDNADFTGTSKTRVDATINRNFGTAAPIAGIAPNTYSVRWTGQVQPKFSETYTFYTTADDGVRLMVNGQVLVNNWVNQGPTTKSGTVTLQAGVKYDLRLEYYQNGGGAQVKMEWQSASQVRQVVPQATLFATGSNLNDALTFLSQQDVFKQLNVQFNPDKVVGSRADKYFLLLGNVQGTKDTVYAIIDQATKRLLGLNRYIRVNGQVSAFNALNKKTVVIGAESVYLDANGRILAAKQEEVKQKLVGLHVEPDILSSLGMQSSQTNGIGAQEVQFTNLCEACRTEARNWAIAATALASFELTHFIAVEAPTGYRAFAAEIIGRGVGVIISDPAKKAGEELVDQNHELYLECVKKNCPAKLIDFKPTELYGAVGEPRTATFSFKNIDTAKMNLEYYAVLVQKDSGDAVSFSEPTPQEGSLAPGTSGNFRVTYTCNQASPLDGFRYGAIFLIRNSDVNKVVFPFTVYCYTPDFEVTQPPPMSTYVNSTTASNFNIKNVSLGYPLNYTVSAPTKPWLQRSPASGTVAAGGQAKVDLVGTCPANPMTESDTLTVTDTATGKSKPVTVTLECIKPPGLNYSTQVDAAYWTWGSYEWCNGAPRCIGWEVVAWPFPGRPVLAKGTYLTDTPTIPQREAGEAVFPEVVKTYYENLSAQELLTNRVKNVHWQDSPYFAHIYLDVDVYNTGQAPPICTAPYNIKGTPC